jgi:hypothetical protein
VQYSEGRVAFQEPTQECTDATMVMDPTEMPKKMGNVEAGWGLLSSALSEMPHFKRLINVGRLLYIDRVLEFELKLLSAVV